MLHHFLHHFYDLWLEMSPWLLAGFFLAFLCSYFLSERWIRKHLGGAGWIPVLKASVMGLPLPVCSCGVLLVALALRRSGARKAPVCAFLASTPQSGTDALLVSFPLLGPLFTLLRFLGAFFSGLAAGALVRWFGIAQPPAQETEHLQEECAAVCACHHHDHQHPHNHGEMHHHEFTTRKKRLQDAFHYAFIHLPGEIAPFLLVGILIAAVIATFMPANLLTETPLWLAYGLAILIGLPTYACSLAIVPIAAGLIAGGLSPGAAFLFMTCAPTTHLGAVLILGKALGWRTVLLYLLAIIGCGLIFALVIDLLFQLQLSPAAATAFTHQHVHNATLQGLVSLPVIFLFVYGLFLRIIRWWQARTHHTS